MLNKLKTGLAWCVLGPICALFLISFSPFLLIAWADNYLTTHNMTPEELEVQKRHKEFLNNDHTGHAYDII